MLRPVCQDVLAEKFFFTGPAGEVVVGLSEGDVIFWFSIIKTASRFIRMDQQAKAGNIGETVVFSNGDPLVANERVCVTITDNFP